MKRFDNIPSAVHTKVLPLKYLVVVVASMMVVPVAQADVAGKRIGDLEIYQAAEGGKVFVTMMLDTSGSMAANVTTAACDLPENVSSTEVGTENSSTTPTYVRRYCESGNRRYFYRLSPANAIPANQWYRCGAIDGSGDDSFNFAICSTIIVNPSIGNEYSFETSGSGNRYYYKANRTYDRLTRLKDALFTLMDGNQLNANKVSIGIGQFSSQSNSSNVYGGADGSSGKIMVPAAPINQTQRDAIKTAIAGLVGENGTPTANAYAEVGAYMLGTNTSTTITTPREEFRFVGRNRGNDFYAQCLTWTGTACTSTVNNSNAQIFNSTPSGYTSVDCQLYNNSTCLASNKTQSAGDWGFSGFSKSLSSAKSGSNYVSPLSSSNATCDGRGIYFLTDGEPNSSPTPVPMMKSALGSKGSAFDVPSSGALPTGSLRDNSMPAVGAFAKALRSSTLNPLDSKDILTAVVGFGSVFDVDKNLPANTLPRDRVIRTLPHTNPKTGRTADRTFYNCALISNIDAKNACNWGEKTNSELNGVGGFGEGGFYPAQSTEDIVKSITDFVADLDNSLPTTSSGTIIIPDDPYRADSQLAVAYYPTVQPQVAENSVVWEGNLKKYRLNEGTLFGVGINQLFTNIAGDLNPAAQDLWSANNNPGANNSAVSGGFYSQLNTPVSGVTSLRTLYVEDWTSATNQSPVLRRVSVNDAGRVLVNNAVLTNTSFGDVNTYNQTTLRRLLNFLGFDNLPATSVAVKDMRLTAANASAPVKVLGATIHSTPASVSYSATLDADGRVTAARDDYVLFGSTEGGLHLVNADNAGTGDGGRERFVIIPKEILSDPNKSAALVKGATKAEIGSPNFGIDAPWLVSADYQYDFSNLRVNIDTTGNKGLYAYGGLRMGGEAFYGLNLNDPDSPSMMFSITPTTAGFSRMGQIWSKPTKARIKTSGTDTGTDVLIFGGGYDMCYENEEFQVGATVPLVGSIVNPILNTCLLKTSTKGNAVYIINARDGSLIWSASNVANATTTRSSTTVGTMTNSVVAGITTLDRDNDGFMDHIYFADLGGQVFRADFTNAGFTRPVTTGTPTPETGFSNTRVTRVLQPAYSGTDTRYNHRFYERPVVSFYRNSGGSLFALVNVISGDRSSPLSKIRDLNKSDRLYGIIDSDVTKADNIFYASNFTTTGTVNGQTVANLVGDSTATSNLLELPSAIGDLTDTGFTAVQKTAAITTLQGTTKNGWYIPLTSFDGFGNVRYTKGIGKSEVIDSFLYTTAYNPDMSYGTVDSCSAKIVGGSERQLYCLPYGICNDATSKNGLGGFVRAGKGIQELTLGPRSSTLSNQRLLIGTRTIADRANDRVYFGTDADKGTFNASTQPNGLNQSLSAADQILGSGSAPLLIHNDRFILQPKTWYEVD